MPRGPSAIKAQHVDAECYRAAKRALRACARASSARKTAEERLRGVFDRFAARDRLRGMGDVDGAEGAEQLGAGADEAAPGVHFDGPVDAELITAVSELQAAQRAYASARKRARAEKSLRTLRSGQRERRAHRALGLVNEHAARMRARAWVLELGFRTTEESGCLLARVPEHVRPLIRAFFGST